MDQVEQNIIQIVAKISRLRYSRTMRSQDSSVSIMMGYKQVGWVSIPGRVKIFLFSTGSILALGPTQPPVQRVPGVTFVGLKQLGHEAYLSPPTTAEVKNCGAIPPLPHMSSWHSS
jgi:hypothetical protein